MVERLACPIAAGSIEGRDEGGHGGGDGGNGKDGEDEEEEGGAEGVIELSMGAAGADGVIELETAGARRARLAAERK